MMLFCLAAIHTEENKGIMEMSETEMKTLHVTMFGGFSLRYGDQDVVLGRYSGTKYVYLFQLIWLHGDQGVSKAQIIRSLYDAEELANPVNTFNNLLYQARRQMVMAGLPPKRYIVRRKKLYMADPEIPLDLDTRNFEKGIEEARAALDSRKKYELYCKALQLYQGVLLPESSTEAWVVTESVRLQKLFEEAIRYAGSFARKSGDYDAMYRIYGQAARIYPDNDWQANQIDALICKENYEQAYELYCKTVKRYSEEMGLPPSEQMLENYRRMSLRLTHQESRLSEIQSSLKEDLTTGAYYTALPGFIDIYRVLARNMERLGNSVFLLLCDLVDYEGKPFMNQEKLKARSESLRRCISSSLRKGDIFTRYSVSQYMVLLIGCNDEGCDVVAKRISLRLASIEGTRAGIICSKVSLADFSGIQ